MKTILFDGRYLGYGFTMDGTTVAAQILTLPLRTLSREPLNAVKCKTIVREREIITDKLCNDLAFSNTALANRVFLSARHRTPYIYI